MFHNSAREDSARGHERRKSRRIDDSKHKHASRKDQKAWPASKITPHLAIEELIGSRQYAKAGDRGDGPTATSATRA